MKSEGEEPTSRRSSKAMISKMSREYKRFKQSWREEEARHGEALQREYESLKALTKLIGKRDLKFEEMDNISFKRHIKTHETEITSEKFSINVIIKDDDLFSHFKVRGHDFLNFLTTNGAVDENRLIQSKAQPVGYYRPDPKKQSQPLKVGDYFIDPLSGFWRKCTLKDLENLEEERKAAIRLSFSSESPLERQVERQKAV